MTPTQNWYDFRASAGDASEVSIYNSIGAFGISAQAFIADLAKHKGKPLDVRVNCPGGSITDASAVFNALQRHVGGVTAHIDGLAASAATYIVCAASKVKMAANALYMIHNPAAGGGGDAEDLRRLAGVLDTLTSSMAATYAAKTRKPEAEIRAKMKAETWYSADEAKAYGFVDEVTGARQVTAHFDLSGFVHPPSMAQRFAASAVNPYSREARTERMLAGMDEDRARRQREVQDAIAAGIIADPAKRGIPFGGR